MRTGAAGIALGSLCFLLTACGGGGSTGGSLPPAAVPATPVPASASISQSVSAASGGTVSVRLASGQSIGLSIPPGALSADTTVTLYGYSNASDLASLIGQANGRTLIGGFAIDLGSAHLLRPLTASESNVAIAPADVARLAVLSARTKSFVDVDTAAVSGLTVANQNAVGYVGVTTAGGTAAPYAFYAIPAQAAATPAPLTIVVTAATPGPYAAGSSVAVSASGSDANGNPYLFQPQFSLDNASLGTVAANAGGGANVTFGQQQMTGNVIASDPRTGVRGMLAVSVQSDRPANDGDRLQYAGTLTQTFVRYAPDPEPTATTDVNVTQNVRVSANQSFDDHPGLYDFHVDETDVSPLVTSTTANDGYYGFSQNAQPGGALAFLLYGTNTTDEAGDATSVTYAPAAIVDQLPEAVGQSWSNSAGASISESVPQDTGGAALTIARSYAADGSYNETTTYPANYAAKDAVGTGQIKENADGSGSYLFHTGAGYAVVNLVYSAPLPQPSASPEVDIAVYNQPNPGPTSRPLFVDQLPSWYGATPVLYQESDVDKGVQPIPAACALPAAFGSTAVMLEQHIDRLDTILGYTESQTTTSYLVQGYGPACVQLSDVQTDYYDFNGDTTSVFSSAPVQVTTIAETLTLQAAGTSVTGMRATRRAASALRAAQHFPFADRGGFDRLVRAERMRREQRFARAIEKRISLRRGGASQ